MHDFQFFGGGWMMFLWLFLLIAMIAIIVKFLFYKNPSRRKYSALEILKRKYAKGEIDKEEFEERKKELE
ncbi:MAG TPA: electron transporter RnfE [Balneolaceae bacterium]|nr:electron transporter RnfE [Balneola sp.]HBQ60865.1 electron transporter RnfE [Balneolaceae bacterium]|tara:strand:+ start:9841 stop:10050 length:210 start_codon:yes stop_codon:yes gene_type:complete